MTTAKAMEGRKERDGRGIAWVHGVPGIPIGVVLHRTWFFFFLFPFSFPSPNPEPHRSTLFFILFLFLLCTWQSTLALTLPVLHPEGSGIQMRGRERAGMGGEGFDRGLFRRNLEGRITYLLTCREFPCYRLGWMDGIEWNGMFERIHTHCTLHYEVR